MKNLTDTITLRPALILFGFLFLHLPAQAITITWDAGGDGVNWSSPNNWNPNQVPTAADDVFLNGNSITIDVPNITVQSLDLGTILTFLSGTTNITVTNNLTMGFAVINTTGNITIGQNLYWSAGNFLGTGSVSVGNDIYFQPYDGFSGQCLTRKAITAVNGFWNSSQPLMDNGGSITFSGNFTANTSGTIDEYTGIGGAFTVNGTFEVMFGISPTVAVETFNSNGTILLAASSSTLNITETFNNNGLIRGVGTLNASGTFNQNGSLSPGLLLSPGKLTLGKLTSGTTTTTIKLQNTGVAGLNYDQIAVSGAGEISGVLDLDFLSGFVPSVGNSFVIMTCNPCSGSFTDVLSPIGSASDWLVNVGTNQVTLTLNTALPVELIEFNGRITAAGVHLLTWRTASEKDNRGFFIERAQDVMNWQEIGFVPGSGTSSGPQVYSFQDLEFHSGINYYRLRQQDFDGKITYSNIVFINNNNSEGDLRLSPNPTTSTLQIEGPDLADATLSILDATGHIVLQLPYQQAQLDLSNLKPGFYYLIVKNQGNTFSGRFVRR